MKITIIFALMFLIFIATAFAGTDIDLPEANYSIEPTDYIFWDNGDEILNGTFRAAPANGADLTTQRYTTSLASAAYTNALERFGNMSIDLFNSGANERNKFDLGSELSNVTFQMVLFEAQADTSANLLTFIFADADATIFSFGVETGANTTHYACDSCAVVDTSVARFDGGVNFTVHIAPANAYAALYINETLHENDTTIAGGLRSFRLRAGLIDAQADDIMVWSGSPEDRPSTPLADIPDVINPVIDSTSINNTNPLLNDVVQISVNATDNINISSAFYANNITGTMENKSSINTSELQLELNYTVNITNTLSAGVVAHIFTVNDTSGNSIQSSEILYTVLFVDILSPRFPNSSINNSVPKINEVVQIATAITDDAALDWTRIAHNQSGVMTNQTIVDISGTEINISVNLTITASKGTVIGYQFWVNDTTDNANTTDVFTFNVVNTPPETPTIIFPTADLRTNTQPENLQVTFPADADSDSITINYYINDTLNSSLATNATFTASDGLYQLKVSITDNTGHSDNATVNFELDTVNPILTVTSPAAATFSTNITVNASCSDSNLFILNYSFFNSSFDLLRTVQNDSVIGGELSILDEINITPLPDGNYILNVSCSDTHTSKKIPDYMVYIDSARRKIIYDTAEGNIITIKLKSVPAGFVLDTITSFKENDRYIFGFTPENTSTNTYVIELTSKYKLNYLKDSEYAGHFTSYMNWIDFVNDDADAVYVITKKNDKKYEIQITTDDLIFKSIGGLNVVTEEIALTIDTAAVAPEEEDFETTGTSGILVTAGVFAIVAVIIIATIVELAIKPLRKMRKGKK